MAVVAMQLHASNAILLWPLDPVIEADDAGAALWVENRGQRTATMQLRVLAWTQAQGESRYAAQTDIIGTPAIFRVAPGKRQFVRLTRTQRPPAGVEQAFRVLIDEIPDGRNEQVAITGTARSGLRFQLRYSIPLFSYGAGLASRKHRAIEAPRLAWREFAEGGRRWIEIRNPGPLHAKLVDIEVRGNDGTAGKIADAHLGYVLPGSTLRWNLPRDTPRVASVHASINGGGATPIDPETP
jgi:fimbrial chaperone protein